MSSSSNGTAAVESRVSGDEQGRVLGLLDRHTSEAVGYPHVLAVILTQQNTNDPPLCLLLGGAIVVIDSGKEDEGRDGDVPGDEREGFCGGGRHR